LHAGSCCTAKIRHSSRARYPDDYIDDDCEQWFQWSLYPRGDLCNFTTCSHEMWVVALAALGIIATVLSFTLPCVAIYVTCP